MLEKNDPVPPSRVVEFAYARGLLKFAREIWAKISQQPDITVQEQIEKLAIPAIAAMLNQSNEYNLKKLTRGLEKISALKAQQAASADVSPLLAVKRVDNINLINDLTAQQRILAFNSIAEVSEIPLKTRLQKALNISSNRARLIARDQTAKTNADLSEIRHKAAGAERYEWSTSGDERVRNLHKSLDGNIYAWGELTGAEDGLPPGKPIQCRCVALAVFD